ncbi:MAG TPA: DUF4105 domain-containing protein [Solimonas sp.]
MEPTRVTAASAAASNAATVDVAYRAELLAAARAQKLSADPYWQTLLHVETSFLGTPRSVAVSDWFFLAPDGRYNAQSELDATLAAFFETQARSPRDEPAQCIYGARYRWLSQRLGFDATRLPQQSCPRRDEWMQALDPQRVWVVFPAAYLNSPASMFGHTLLRLDGREVSDGTALLAYAVNFAANTDETNGLVFAAKGLTGGYRGQFSVLPYYEKVKEYSRLESRDLWEYPLDLDEAQTQMLLLHLWEMRGVEFDYYFFTKNCSYQLLTLLQAARPDLQWGDQYRWRAIPTDTLKTTAPLSGDPDYRPSLSTQIAHHATQLSPPELRLARALADGQRAADDDALTALPAEARARVLGVSHDLLYRSFLAGDLPREVSVPRSQTLLRARAQTGVRGGFEPPPRPAVAPDRGHATRRFAAEAGVLDDAARVMLRLRPAYHDLLDEPAGYSDGQQINFLDLAVGIEPETGRWLGEAQLIDIVSIAPRSAVFSPISWRVRLAAERADYGRGLTSALLEGGPGLSWGQHAHLVGYGFLFAQMEANKDLARGHDAGIGPLLGALWRPRAGWQLQLEAAWLDSLDDDGLDRRWVRLGQQWQLRDDVAVRLRVGGERRAGDHTTEATLALQRYF